MKKTIKVTDIYCQAYLQVGELKEDEVIVEMVDGRRRVAFIYNYSKEIEDAIDQYYASDFMRDWIKWYLRNKRVITRILKESE